MRILLSPWGLHLNCTKKLWDSHSWLSRLSRNGQHRTAKSGCPTLLNDRNERGAGGLPLPIFLNKHAQHARIGSGLFAVDVFAAEPSMVCRKSEIRIHGHQFEFAGMRADAFRGMRRSLPGNHLGLGLHFALDGHFEKLIGPKLVAEFDALLVILVIRSCAPAAEPLLI